MFWQASRLIVVFAMRLTPRQRGPVGRSVRSIYRQHDLLPNAMLHGVG